MMKLSSWGKFPVIEGILKNYSSAEEAKRKISGMETWIPRGLGRSYGDSALAGEIVSSLNSNRILDFNTETGVFSCEAGVSFAEILELVVPAGWFLPVTPGTKFITLGGAIGSDVHGKNHHGEGSFSRHLISFDLLLPNGEIITCSPESSEPTGSLDSSGQNAGLFWATCGGMGLTGLVLRGTFQLKKIETAYVRQVSKEAKNLEDIFVQFDANMGWTYSMAWLDTMASGSTLGRSVMHIGEHASLKELQGTKFANDPLKIPKGKGINIPFNFPSFALNAVTIKLINETYYRLKTSNENEQIASYEPFFYPLDSFHNWNRAYGKRGFTQYQLVMPPEKSYDGIVKILEKCRERRFFSFLTVLKYFGKQEGLMSFPMEGYTLTLDFPITDALFPFLDELDSIVLDHGGRLYLTKDVRMSPEMLKRGYPNLSKFQEIRASISGHQHLQSLQSKRVGI